VEIREVPDPRIRRRTDVLLKVEAIGVCGSDIHYYTTGRIGSQVVKYPFRVGHECSGTVLRTGPGVKRVKPGDRVVIDPAVSCGRCDQCRAGRYHTCRKLTFLGTPGQGEGSLCEYLVMPESCCYRVGRRISTEAAALVEPLSIGVYCVALSIPMPGKRIGILGFGPIGLSVLLAAKDRGARTIYVTDKIDCRLERARRLGASWTGNPDRQDIVAAVAEREPLLLDAVFECCGRQEALDQAVDLLKPGGKLIIVGIPEADRVSFSIDKLRRREICVQNVRRQNECVQAAIDLLEKRKIKADLMVTHRFSLEETKAAFDLAASYGDGVFKAMILP
jgi:L-iditol 2-dehydrogenase